MQYYPFDNFPQLETDNIVLRQIKSSDAEAIFHFFSDINVLKYHNAEVFTTVERAARLIHHWDDRFLSRKGIRWGIVRKGESTIIGTCGYRFWGKPLFCAEIGYELTKAYWRQGIMSDALRTIIKFGFEVSQLNRIEATVMLENTASMKLLGKLGFVEEGILREYGFWKEQFHDLKIFSLLKKDYDAIL
jgi:[ribosomal protein S5]-alanine N-acetyltransferase